MIPATPFLIQVIPHDDDDDHYQFNYPDSDVWSTDPRDWSESDIEHWFNWTIREFSLEGVNQTHLNMDGKEMCSLAKEEFLSRTPPFMGDILWEHLDIMQKG